ncbi:MAG: trypsin-like peptidase domain-containing protein [Anaerolineales bacterium]|nr:MAG: trypsin-like peptidase domain-containing protein [Anaerolineales bacterium]
MNTDTETSSEGGSPAAGQHGYTGCMVVTLLAVAFLIGGLLGGMAGGGLVLWATDTEVSLWWMTPTPTGTPAPTPDPDPTLTPTPFPPTPTITPSPSPSPSIADVVSQVVPAVVTVVNQQAGARIFGVTVDSRILGSGIVIDSRGYIVTNYHVVEPINPLGGEGELTVILDTGEALPASLVASDQRQDLALLRVENGDMPVVDWGDSQQVRPGEWVVAIGSALGDFPNSVTVGVVSGVNRALELDDDITIEGLIQTDAAINKGNSGGPLVNLSGEVIGINTFIIREGRSSGVAEGIGFAIPSTMARDLAAEWISSDASLIEP